jgi:hypothetical protein
MRIGTTIEWLKAIDANYIHFTDAQGDQAQKSSMLGHVFVEYAYKNFSKYCGILE